MMVMADHDEALRRYGPGAPESTFAREVHAAASVSVACPGLIAPPIDPLYVPLLASNDAAADALTSDDIFDDAHSGTVLSTAGSDCGQEA